MIILFDPKKFYIEYIVFFKEIFDAGALGGEFPRMNRDSNCCAPSQLVCQFFRKR